MLQEIMSKEKLEHSPNLRTVIMVEDTLKNMDNSIVKVSELKKALPRQVNHNTLMLILEYLEESNKIAVSVKGITWIHNTSKKLQKEIAKGIEVGKQ